MCVIIDTDMINKYINPKPTNKKEILKQYEAMELLKQYIEKKKIKLISPPKVNALSIQYKKISDTKGLLEEYSAQGFIKTIDPEDLKRAEQELAFKEKKHKTKYKSNDFPILVLAKASNTKLLVSADEKLGTDFKKIIGGSIYKHKTKRERKLLDNNKCS